MTVNQKSRFANLPIDNEGRIVRFTDPGFMMEEDVITWRDHILETFREREDGEPQYHRPFRFLTMAGKKPTLTMLKMGSTSKKPTVTPKAKKGKKSAPEKTKAAKRKAKGKGKKVVEVSDEEGSERESGEQSDDEDEVPPKAQKAPRPQRDAGNKAKPAISMQALREAEEEVELLRRKELERQTSDPKGPCPGKDKSLQKMEFHGTRTIRRTNDELTSLYLQRPNAMGHSTLPEDWRTEGWNRKEVCFFQAPHQT
jgi:hypothetical protein